MASPLGSLSPTLNPAISLKIEAIDLERDDLTPLISGRVVHEGTLYQITMRPVYLPVDDGATITITDSVEWAFQRDNLAELTQDNEIGTARHLILEAVVGKAPGNTITPSATWAQFIAGRLEADGRSTPAVEAKRLWGYREAFTNAWHEIARSIK